MKGFVFTKKKCDYYNDNGYEQSIFIRPIPYDEVFCFQIKIIEARSRNIGIGVVDYEKIKNI